LKNTMKIRVFSINNAPGTISGGFISTFPSKLRSKFIRKDSNFLLQKKHEIIPVKYSVDSVEIQIPDIVEGLAEEHFLEPLWNKKEINFLPQKGTKK
jgi:hypothetical protein